MQDYQSMASILPVVKINTDSENLIKKNSDSKTN